MIFGTFCTIAFIVRVRLGISKPKELYFYAAFTLLCAWFTVEALQH
jgi:hypothetical protein